MKPLDAALILIKNGFHVLPLQPNTKIPALKDFPNKASRDPDQIKKWFDGTKYNIGISTSKYQDDKALVVIDVDNKNGKNGAGELLKFQKAGKEVPNTFIQNTPSGGKHLVYYVDTPVRQGTNVLAPGLDIRSKGGQIAAFGSTIDGKEYEGSGLLNIVECPKWVTDICGKAPVKELTTKKVIETIRTSINRAIEYLRDQAPVAVEGDGGDATTYKVCARLKDFGVNQSDTLFLLLDHWNDKCHPPWSRDELETKVKNAYEYGNKEQGHNAPEKEFSKIERATGKDVESDPLKKLNENYAYVVNGGLGHVLWETTDHLGNFKVEHLSVQTFHQLLASRMLPLGNNRMTPLSEAWMKYKKRRTYQGICFSPEKEVPSNFYNLWRGFSVEVPKSGEKFTPKAVKSLALFKEHLLQNVCANDLNLFHWLMSYFAHMFQRPGEKPLTALVFRGSKGVGKNAFIDCIGHMLGTHYLLTSNRRYLIGNFNAHLEKLILLTFDEAFWSGDKQAEGILKDLITGKQHVVERKGKETYSVANKTRVIILGNEEWLVPASHDERRYAVFNVGDKRKRDFKFFISMREGMEEGGYRLLLQYLLSYNFTGINLSEPPDTKGLRDQKDASLSPFHQWWRECLIEERIVGSDVDVWPKEIERCMVREAYLRHAKKHNVRSRSISAQLFGKLMNECAPGIGTHRKTLEDGTRPRTYVIPNVPFLRNEWDAFMGYKSEWDVCITD